MDLEVDIDLLITLVENRPVLWDKTLEGYKNKQLNYDAWKEIFIKLNENFKTLSDKDKIKFGKHVMKKWNNTRDNWMRCEKKLTEHKSGEKPIHKYKYYDELQFLKKIVSHRPTSTTQHMPPAEDVDESQSTDEDESAVSKKRRKKRAAPEKDKLGKRIDRLVDSVEKEDNSRIMSFFKGIAPTIERFDDADIVEFQYEVIKAMRNISQRTRSP